MTEANECDELRAENKRLRHQLSTLECAYSFREFDLTGYRDQVMAFDALCSSPDGAVKFSGVGEPYVLVSRLRRILRGEL